jgi:hypothetical protein
MGGMSLHVRLARNVAALGLSLTACSGGAALEPVPSGAAPSGAPVSPAPSTATAAAGVMAVVPVAPVVPSGAVTAPAPSGVTSATSLPVAGAAVGPTPAGNAAPIAGAGPTTAPSAPAGAVTYHHDIRPILEDRCVSCHVAGGAGPFPLDTWENVDKFKIVVVPAVTSHRMPPWPADDTNCTKQRNKQRLTDAQIALFTRWQQEGFAQGAPAEFAPIVDEDPPLNIGEPNLIVTPVPYQLTGNYEGYICSQTDARLTEDVWVTALDVKPEHTQYVHHAIVNVGSGNCDALGTTAENIYSYRPGSRTVVFEKGDAMLLKAGQTIAIQFHFNTRGAAPAASYPTDSSPLRLWTLPKGQKPQRQIHRQPIHSFAINIPVGAVDQLVTTTQTVEAGPGTEIIGISPHMHLLGQRFKQTLGGAAGSNTCLVDIPDWDQSWQIDYMFKPSAYIKGATGLTVTQDCVYSNRPEDQGLGPDGKKYAPQPTTFGEDTRNEMCLGYIWYRQPVAGTTLGF